MITEDRELEQNIVANAVAAPENCAALLDETRDDDFFYYRREVAILRELYNAGKPVDAVSFVQELRIREIDTALGRLLIGADIWRNERHHIAELRRLAKARRLLHIAQSIENCIAAENADVDEIAGMVARKLDESDSAEGADELVTPELQADRMLQTLGETLDSGVRQKQLIFTGAKRLDDVLGGLESGDTVILSGCTGRGKTAFAMNLVEDIAIRQKIPTLYINTEMSQRQIDLRWMAQISRSHALTNTNLRNGVLSDADLNEVTRAIGAMAKSQYYLTTAPELTLTKLLAKMRRYTARHGIRVVVVDYLGRMDTDGVKAGDEWRVLLGMVKKIKMMSQKLGVVSLVLAQATDEGKLSRSRLIEQECDIHLQVRELDDNERDEVDRCYNTILEIRKGRNSARKKIPCRFNGEKLKFLFDPSDAWAHYRNVAAQAPLSPPVAAAAADADEDDSGAEWRSRRKRSRC